MDSTVLTQWLTEQAPVVVLALGVAWYIARRSQQREERHDKQIDKLFEQYHQDSLDVAKTIEAQRQLLETLVRTQLER